MTVVRRIIVTGRVQGVGYREWTARTAVGLSLDGWVRNRRDGSVEMVVSGPQEAATMLVERCHGGPAMARVDHLHVEPSDEAVGRGFEIRATA